MRRTPREDREQHNERLFREYLELTERYYGQPDSLTRPDGMPLDYLPNEHRTVRASESSWDHPVYRTGHTVGVAPGTEDAATESTVLVTRRDGSSEVVPASSFRRRVTRARQTQQIDRTPDVLRYNVGTADYLAGGDA